MFKVTYSYYGKYLNEKTFDSYAGAKKFFYIMSRKTGVKRVELVTL